MNKYSSIVLLMFYDDLQYKLLLQPEVLRDIFLLFQLLFLSSYAYLKMKESLKQPLYHIL